MLRFGEASVEVLSLQSASESSILFFTDRSSVETVLRRLCSVKISDAALRTLALRSRLEGE